MMNIVIILIACGFFALLYYEVYRMKKLAVKNNDKFFIFNREVNSTIRDSNDKIWTSVEKLKAEFMEERRSNISLFIENKENVVKLFKKLKELEDVSNQYMTHSINTQLETDSLKEDLSTVLQSLSEIKTIDLISKLGLQDED